MVTEDSVLIQRQQQQQQTNEIYKKALTFNVIAKYDPLINQLLHVNSYCVIYKFDIDSNDWVKLDYQGPLGIYSRVSNEKKNEEGKFTFTSADVLANDELYDHALILLNRNKPLNFSIGLINSKKLTTGDDDDDDDNDDKIIIEQNGDLIIIKTLDNQTFGIWIFDKNDRDYIYKILKYCID